jgi:hypothetical protein
MSHKTPGTRVKGGNIPKAQDTSTSFALVPVSLDPNQQQERRSYGALFSEVSVNHAAVKT